MDKVLKILSGIHLGAQLDLPCGRTLLIGTSDDCDIVLDDGLVAPEHVLLAWDDSGAPVSATFRQAGFIGQREIAAGMSVPLSDLDVISIGATQFAIGAPDTAWNRVALPEWQALHATLTKSENPAKVEKEPATAPENEKTGDATPEGAGDAAAGETEPETSAEQSNPAPTAASADTPARPAPRRHRSWLNVWTGVLMVLFAVCGFAVLPFLRKGGNQAMADTAGNILSISKDTDAEMRAACARLGLTCSKKDGLWTAKGLFKDNKSLQKAKTELRSISRRLDFQATSDDQIMASAEQVIKGFGYPLAVTAGDDGQLRLSGTAPSEQDLNYVVTRLRSDVPGIKKFDVNVELLSRVSDALTSELVSLRLRDVKLELANGVLLAKGSIPGAKANEWHTKLTAWKKQYRSISKIEDRTEILPLDKEVVAELDEETSPALASPIASIQISPLASFQTRDGQVYFPNAIIGNGYIVDSIKQNGIWIRPTTGGAHAKSWISIGQSQPRKD